MVLQSATTAVTDSVVGTQSISEERESLFPMKSLSLAFSHFTWGVDLGGSIDLQSNDMSTFDVDVNLGYKNDFIRIAGVGAGVQRAFGTGHTFIPVYALFRSSFRSKPSLFFLNLKAGYSFNTIKDASTFGDFSTSIGVGVNLAMSKRFKSHIILSYCYRYYSQRHRLENDLDIKNSNLAQITFGVNF